MNKLTLAAALAASALLAAACGGSDAPVDNAAGGSGAAGACHVDNPDCVDTDFGDGDGDSGDEFDTASEREAARGLLGLTEAELAPDVRIARKGAESFALTEDYQLGRKTVDLDQDDEGGWVVTKVVVELPDGPETFTL